MALQERAVQLVLLVTPAHKAIQVTQEQTEQLVPEALVVQQVLQVTLAHLVMRVLTVLVVLVVQAARLVTQETQARPVTQVITV
jgi:hypothetical protein